LSIELFKINTRKALASLLPFGREHKFAGPEGLMKEIQEHGILKPERSYIFFPYRAVLTIEGRDRMEFPLFSVSAWIGKETRALVEDEKREVISAMEEAFPDHKIDVIEGGFLGNPPTFKVVGIPKSLAETGGRTP